MSYWTKYISLLFRTLSLQNKDNALRKFPLKIFLSSTKVDYEDIQEDVFRIETLGWASHVFNSWSKWYKNKTKRSKHKQYTPCKLFTLSYIFIICFNNECMVPGSIPMHSILCQCLFYRSLELIQFLQEKLYRLKPCKQHLFLGGESFKTYLSSPPAFEHLQQSSFYWNYLIKDSSLGITHFHKLPPTTAKYQQWFPLSIFYTGIRDPAKIMNNAFCLWLNHEKNLWSHLLGCNRLP